MLFDSAVFAMSTPGERVAICRAFAAEANGKAADAGGETGEGYANLAKAWSELAAEIEKLAGGSQ